MNQIVTVRPNLNRILQDAMDNGQKIEMIIVSDTHWYLKVAQPQG